MTATPVSNLESEQIPDPTGHSDDQSSTAIAGKSPTKLAVERFRTDRLSMFSLAVVLLYVVAGITAPILVTSGYPGRERPSVPGWKHSRRAERDGWAADLHRRE